MKDIRKSIKIGSITLREILILCSEHYTINPDTCYKNCVLRRNFICDRKNLAIDRIGTYLNKRVVNPFRTQE